MPAVFGLDNKLPVLLYDLSIEDLEERRNNVIELKSLNRAAEFLGCTLDRIKRNCVPGGRVYSKKQQRNYAPRFKKGYHHDMVGSSKNFTTLN